MLEWGDKMIYLNKNECLFISYVDDETKNKALILLKDSLKIAIASICELDFFYCDK